MIGDPKQAIYRFRGADIFTYLKASDEAQSRFELTKIIVQRSIWLMV